MNKIMARKIIGQRVKILRTINAIKQKELANIVGITQKTVSFWESGQTFPSIPVLLSLCEIFHVDFDFFNPHNSHIDTEKIKRAEPANK